MSNKIYLIFQSTRKVILAERECKGEGLNCLAVPVPREFSSQCGIALEVDSSEIDKARELLQLKKFEYKEFKKEVQ